MLKLSSNGSDVFPKVLKLSSEVSECKPLFGGPGKTVDRNARTAVGQCRLKVSKPVLKLESGACGFRMRMLLPLEATIPWTAFKVCFNFNLRRYTKTMKAKQDADKKAGPRAPSLPPVYPLSTPSVPPESPLSTPSVPPQYPLSMYPHCPLSTPSFLESSEIL